MQHQQLQQQQQLINQVQQLNINNINKPGGPPPAQPSTLQQQSSPNSIHQITQQLRKLGGTANLKNIGGGGGGGGGGITMKHGNLLGMQLPPSVPEDASINIGNSANTLMFLNTQRIGQVPNNIEFLHELNAPSSTKSIPVAQIKKSNTNSGSKNIQLQSTNTLGSGRRQAALAEEPTLSAKKRQGLVQQKNSQMKQAPHQQNLNSQTSNQSLQDKTKKVGQSSGIQFSSAPTSQINSGQVSSTTTTTLQASQPISALKNSVMLAAAAAQNGTQTVMMSNASIQKQTISQNQTKNTIGRSHLNNPQTTSISQSDNVNSIQSIQKSHGGGGLKFQTIKINQLNTDMPKTHDSAVIQRDHSSSNSDKLNNSLLKLKSRNRCNENLNLGGAPQVGAPIEKQSSLPKNSQNTSEGIVIASNPQANSFQKGGQQCLQNPSLPSYQQQLLNLSQEYVTTNPLQIVSSSSLTLKGDSHKQESQINLQGDQFKKTIGKALAATTSTGTELASSLNKGSNTAAVTTEAVKGSGMIRTLNGRSGQFAGTVEVNRKISENSVNQLQFVDSAQLQQIRLQGSDSKQNNSSNQGGGSLDRAVSGGNSGLVNQLLTSVPSSQLNTNSLLLNKVGTTKGSLPPPQRDNSSSGQLAFNGSNGSLQKIIKKQVNANSIQNDLQDGNNKLVVQKNNLHQGGLKSAQIQIQNTNTNSVITGSSSLTLKKNNYNQTSIAGANTSNTAALATICFTSIIHKNQTKQAETTLSVDVAKNAQLYQTINSSKSPTGTNNADSIDNKLLNQQQITKAAVSQVNKPQINKVNKNHFAGGGCGGNVIDSQGIFLQTERVALQNSKLSMSHEFPNSARECEMSTTINFPQNEDAATSQTLVLFNSNGGGGDHSLGNSPQNQTSNNEATFNKSNTQVKNTNGSSILKRRAVGSSQHIVSSLAPSQAKRRHPVKAGSVNQRITEENGQSSPSGGQGTGVQNNASNSIGNKSQHYGLSSQSFLTNSNSNGGSNPRTSEPQQQFNLGAPSSARLNTSGLGASLYNHQRQKSGGFFQQTLGLKKEQTGCSSNASSQAKKNNEHNLNNKQEITDQIKKPQSQAIHSVNSKKVIFGQQQQQQHLQSQEMDLSQHSIKQTLSGSSLNQAKLMAQNTQQMHLTLHQHQLQASLSSRPQYPQHQVISSGDIILNNKSKSSFKGTQETTSNLSSRSNSIKKRTSSATKIHNSQQLNASANKRNQAQDIQTTMRNNYMSGCDDSCSLELLSPQNHHHHIYSGENMNNQSVGALNTSTTKGQKNTLRKSLQQNRQQYNNTVEEMTDFQNTSSLNQSILHQQQSFSNEQLVLNSTPALGQVNQHQLQLQQQQQQQLPLKKTLIAQPGMNRSVIVETSNKIISSRGGKKEMVPASGQKNLPSQEFEQMKIELKSKDMLIQNLRDRLVNLEEKVNGIQVNQQIVVQHRNRNNRTAQENGGSGDKQGNEGSDSERARDKSQQRIKEAILNLERKLEQFRLEKDQNNQRLEELKQYSSSQHSSSRHSELQLQNQRSLHQQNDRYLQTMIEAGLLPSLGAFPGTARPQTYLLTGSSYGDGFITHTLGGPQRKMQKSTNSLIEDLESLITITENEDALGAAVDLQKNHLGNQLYLEDFLGDPSIHTPLFYDANNAGSTILSAGQAAGRQLNINKIKTPMFEDHHITNNLSGDSVEELKMIMADEDDEEGHQDNSCLIMLEKEWQEAQKQKLIAEGAIEAAQLGVHNQNIFLGGSGGEPKNISHLFDDQSLIGSSNNQMLPQQQRNNLTQNNIVFFFDEDTTLDEAVVVSGDNDNEEDIERMVEEDYHLPMDDIALAAKGGKEKFVKTQKIEFSNKDRVSLGLNQPLKRKGMHENNSLSPPSSSNNSHQITGLHSRKLKKQTLNLVSGSNLKQKQSQLTGGAYHLGLSNHQTGGGGVATTSNGSNAAAPTFSRTHSKTTLLAKIRNAIGKNAASGGNQDLMETAMLVVSQQPKKKGVTGSPSKKLPRRFIVKRSQERNASTSNNQLPTTLVQSYQQQIISTKAHYNTKPVQNSQVIAIQPLKLKTKVTATAGGVSAGRSLQEELVTLENHQQQEQLMKTIVQQKEKIAQTQKDALKKERELSLKLRQAIQKLNLKIQMQQTGSNAQSNVPASQNTAAIGIVLTSVKKGGK